MLGILRNAKSVSRSSAPLGKDCGCVHTAETRWFQESSTGKEQKGSEEVSNALVRKGLWVRPPAETRWFEESSTQRKGQRTKRVRRSLECFGEDRKSKTWAQVVEVQQSEEKQNSMEILILLVEGKRAKRARQSGVSTRGIFFELEQKTPFRKDLRAVLASLFGQSNIQRRISTSERHPVRSETRKESECTTA